MTDPDVSPNGSDQRLATSGDQLRWILSRVRCIGWFHLPDLSTHDQVDSGKDALHLSLGHFPRSLDQLPLINGYELRHISHRIAIEPRVLCGQQHVARGCRPAEVAREDNTNNRGDLAAAERI